MRLRDKINIAITRLQEFSKFTQGKGYYLAFSGGKDSVVIKALADMAKVKYEAYYNATTIDPPDLIKFIRKNYPDVIFELPKIPFLKKVRTKGIPTRQSRWCCEYLKESGGKGRFVVTGIRWAESPKRAKRRLTEYCYKDTGKRYLHPIIDWTERDVWMFIERYTIPYCILYDEGFARIGCLFCPMVSAKKKKEEAEKYPKFAQAFERSFEALRQNRIKKNNNSVRHWRNGKEMFDWYISNLSIIKWKKAQEGK